MLLIGRRRIPVVGTTRTFSAERFQVRTPPDRRPSSLNVGCAPERAPLQAPLRATPAQGHLDPLKPEAEFRGVFGDRYVRPRRSKRL